MKQSGTIQAGVPNLATYSVKIQSKKLIKPTKLLKIVL